MSKMILLEASIGITIAQLCVIIVWNLIKPCFSTDWTRCRQKQTNDVIDENIDDDITHE